MKTCVVDFHVAFQNSYYFYYANFHDYQLPMNPTSMTYARTSMTYEYDSISHMIWNLDLPSEIVTTLSIFSLL